MSFRENLIKSYTLIGQERPSKKGGIISDSDFAIDSSSRLWLQKKVAHPHKDAILFRSTDVKAHTTPQTTEAAEAAQAAETRNERTA